MRKYLTLFFVAISTFFVFNKCSALSGYGYQNPTGHNSLTSFFEGLLTSIQGYVGWLAVLFIVIGGVLYITSAGSESQITLAKNTIGFSLLGFALAIAGPSLLKEIKDLLSVPGTPIDIDSSKSIIDIISDALSLALTIVIIASMASIIYSGVIYLTSRGDQGQTDKAKNIFIYSVIALVLSGSSIIIITTVLNLLDI